MKKIIIAVALMLLSSSALAGSYTPNLNLYKPAPGEKNVGPMINNNTDILDETINNILSTGISTAPASVYPSTQKYTLAAADAEAYSKGMTLQILNHYTINSSMTFSSPVSVPSPSFGFTIASGVTVSFAGGFNSGRNQVFSCSTTTCVYFASGAMSEVYPEWWGAKADSKTSSGLQNHNATVSAFASNGGVVSFGTGTYYLTEYSPTNGLTNIVMPSNSTLRGQGRGITILSRYTTTSDHTVAAGHWITPRGSNWTIENITLNGNGQSLDGSPRYYVAGHTIETSHSTDGTIRNCEVYDMPQGYLGCIDCSNILVDGNTFHGIDGGINITGGCLPDELAPHDNIIRNNTFYGVGYFGINFDGMVSGQTITNYNGTGETVTCIESRARNNKLINNVIYSSSVTAYGIGILNALGTEVSGNTVYIDKNDMNGIAVTTNNRDSIITNNVLEFTNPSLTNAFGISISGITMTEAKTNPVSIKGNTIKTSSTITAISSTEVGITVDGRSANVESNVISGMLQGVLINSENNSLSYSLYSNQVTSCAYGIYISGEYANKSKLLLKGNGVSTSSLYDLVIGTGYLVSTLTNSLSSHSTFSTSQAVYGDIANVVGTTSVENSDHTVIDGTTANLITATTTTLTADHSVIFDPNFGHVTGLKYKIIRTSPGSYNLYASIYGVGALKALAQNTWCEVEWTGTTWILTGYGTL